MGLIIVSTKRAQAEAAKEIIQRPPAPSLGRKLMHFDAWTDIGIPDAKKFDTIKDGSRIVDYQNVKIRGYLSTFLDTTPSDRQGDYVEPGAFTDTIPKFLRNPVLLVNHMNGTQNIAGSFTTVREDKKGLYVEADLSNAPSEIMRDTRAKVAEGHLRTLSMGGIFHYADNGRGIFRVDLYEGSLVAVPANPDALFSVRALTESEIEHLVSQNRRE